MIYAGSTKILPIVNDKMAIFYDMTVYLSLHLQGREHQAVIKKRIVLTYPTGRKYQQKDLVQNGEIQGVKLNLDF